MQFVGLALGDEQRLGGPADPAAPVGEDRLGGADAARLRTGDGVDADPLALGHALEVDGEVDVDEDVLRQSSTALIPLPTSAATSARCNGVGSSPSTSGWRIRIQTVAGPGSRNAPATAFHSIAVW